MTTIIIYKVLFKGGEINYIYFYPHYKCVYNPAYIKKVLKDKKILERYQFQIPRWSKVFSLIRITGTNKIIPLNTRRHYCITPVTHSKEILLVATQKNRYR